MCPDNPDRDKICVHCGKPGHTGPDCWAKRAEERSRYKAKQMTKSECVAAISQAEENADSEDEEGNAGNIGVILETDSDSKDEGEKFGAAVEREDVMGIKRAADGQPAPKQPLAATENLLNPAAEPSPTKREITELPPSPKFKPTAAKKAAEEKKKLVPKKKKKVAKRKSDKHFL